MAFPGDSQVAEQQLTGLPQSGIIALHDGAEPGRYFPGQCLISWCNGRQGGF